jgi:hypothetical protein
MLIFDVPSEVSGECSRTQPHSPGHSPYAKLVLPERGKQNEIKDLRFAGVR